MQLQFLSSWWWAVCRPKHVEQLRNIGVINSTTRLHLVCSFYYDARIHEHQIYKRSQVHRVISTNYGAPLSGITFAPKFFMCAQFFSQVSRTQHRETHKQQDDLARLLLSLSLSLSLSLKQQNSVTMCTLKSNLWSCGCCVRLDQAGPLRHIWSS